MKVKPFPFQRDNVMDMEDWGGRVLNADDMGLGKTITTLAYFYRNPDALPAIIVCPASVKYQWEHHALENLGIRATVLEGQTPPRESRFERSDKLVIINYDILHYWLDWLKRFRFETWVGDEVQFFKNPAAKRSKAVRTLARRCNRRIGLSGTPLTNRPIELYPTLNIIRPDIFRSRWTFASEFCAPKYTNWGWDLTGSSNLDKLNRLLRRHLMIRHRKQDVMSQLPKKMREVLTLPLRDPAEYAEAENNFETWLFKQDPAAVRKAMRAEALVKVGYLLRLAAKLKAKFVHGWMEEWLASNPGEKLVVFAVHKGLIRVLRERCSAKSVLVDGSVTGRHRKLAVEQFVRDKETRLFFGNLQAAGTGVDGLQVAQTAIIIELPWVPGLLSQAESRIDRIGQTSTSWIYYLLAHGTIETTLAEVLQRKQSVLSAVLDGNGSSEDLNVFDLLMAAIRKKEGGIVQ